MTTTKRHGGPGRNQGRKPIGDIRGGLQPILVNVFGDQAERLRDVPGGASCCVRAALDYWFRAVDIKGKELDKKLGQNPK